MGGQPKHQLTLGGKPLLEHVIDRALPQVAQLLLNFNPPIPTDIVSQHPNLPIIEDSLPGHLGPLAGVLSALEWMQKNCDRPWLASFAVDTPLFPLDLVTRLLRSRHGQSHGASAQLICPTYGGYKQPTFCLWHIDQAEALKNWLIEEQNYRMGAWLKQQDAHYCDLSAADSKASPEGTIIDPFTNINNPEDLSSLAQALMSED